MFIGLTGRNAAGKGEAAEFFQARGFNYLSLSDLLREELAARGLPATRENLTGAGKALRASQGAGVLATRAMKKLSPEIVKDKDWVIDSIRAPAEVTALRALPGFTLLAIDAPAELRFARLRARGRTGDSASLEEFIAHEAAEDTADPNGQQLSATFGLADVIIANAGERTALLARLQEFLTQMRKAG